MTNKCKECNYIWHQLGLGHCYMFKDEPQYCAQFKLGYSPKAGECEAVPVKSYAQEKSKGDESCLVTTEQKIREAFERIITNSGFNQTVTGYIMFKAGYLALLNELEPVSAKEGGKLVSTILYRLPEGVRGVRTP